MFYENETIITKNCAETHRVWYMSCRAKNSADPQDLSWTLPTTVFSGITLHWGHHWRQRATKCGDEAVGG